MLRLEEALGKASIRFSQKAGLGRGMAVRQSCPSCAQHQALPSACCGTGQCPLNCCAQCHPSLVRWPGVGAHFFPTLRDPSRLLDPIPEQREWDYIFLALPFLESRLK